MQIPVYGIPYFQLLTILGLSLFFGYLSSILLERAGIPNVVVYLLTGLLVGNFVVPGLYDTVSLRYWYQVIEAIALGLIGFKVGTEVNLREIRSELKLLLLIILGQVVVVFLLVFGVAWLWTGDRIVALIFGGLATASAPAATMEIIRKFNASGPLTTRIAWSLALIDVTAVVIVETILIFSRSILLGASPDIVGLAGEIGLEIGGSLLLGVALGLVIDYLIEFLDDSLQMMEITLGGLILAIGLAAWMELSLILTTITIGATTVNREGDSYKEAVDILEIVMSPVLILFFVLVGSKIQLAMFRPEVFPWFALLFLTVRALGKWLGSYIGAVMGQGSERVKKYLGLGMIPQGGLVLGLITVANAILQEAGRPDIGDLIVSTVIIATLFSEMIGSFGAMVALGRTGEVDPEKAKDNPITELAID